MIALCVSGTADEASDTCAQWPARSHYSLCYPSTDQFIVNFSHGIALVKLALWNSNALKQIIIFALNSSNRSAAYYCLINDDEYRRVFYRDKQGRDHLTNYFEILPRA